MADVFGVAVVMGLVGLAILVVLWPGAKQGERLLRRWGVDHPTGDDVAEAVRYLKRRRFCYPWLFLVLPVLGTVTGLGQGDAVWTVGGTVLFGGLLGELLALRPSRGPRRQASLARRAVHDIVPVWALVLLALAVGGGIARYAVQGRWAAVGVVVACAVVAGCVVALAVWRPSAGDPLVDLVLRARSARVATGLAIGATVALPGVEVTAAAGAVFVLGLAALLAVVGPHRSVAAAR